MPRAARRPSRRVRSTLQKALSASTDVLPSASLSADFLGVLFGEAPLSFHATPSSRPWYSELVAVRVPRRSEPSIRAVEPGRKALVAAVRLPARERILLRIRVPAGDEVVQRPARDAFVDELVVDREDVLVVRLERGERGVARADGLEKRLAGVLLGPRVVGLQVEPTADAGGRQCFHDDGSA